MIRLRTVERFNSRWATPALSFVRRCVAPGLLLLLAACNQPPVLTPKVQPLSGRHTFEGIWAATGTRQTINLENNHYASIFDLTGSLFLVGDQGLGAGFQAKAIGFSDDFAGMQGRCVWTDERGDKIYSDLKGERVGTGKHITGTIVGGTGRFVGVTGEYSFQWEYVIESDDGSVSGKAVNLKGSARFGPAPVPQSGEPSK
jgi:hypothetical protein